jgi:heme A synthase
LAALWLACETLIDRREPELRSAATTLLALLALQLALGAATAAFRLTPLPRASYPMIATATIHLAVGAFLLGTATLLTFRLFRLTEKN